jgi:hypothetical protein
MWSVDNVIKWLYVSLVGILAILIPFMYILKKRELADKAKKEENVRKKAEYDRQKMLEFYESSTERNNMEIEKLKKS